MLFFFQIILNKNPMLSNLTLSYLYLFYFNDHRSYSHGNTMDFSIIPMLKIKPWCPFLLFLHFTQFLVLLVFQYFDPQFNLKQFLYMCYLSYVICIVMPNNSKILLPALPNLLLLVFQYKDLENVNIYLVSELNIYI